MAAGNKRKRIRHYTRKMDRRLVWLFVIVFIGLAVLLGRITIITMTSGNKYARRVLSQQNYDSQTIPFRRGEIMDRNGIILAKSDLVYNVILDCKYCSSDPKFVEPTIRALVSHFELDEEKIRSLLTDEKTKDSQYQILAKMVTEEQKRAFEAYTSATDQENLSDEQILERKQVRGVWFEQGYKRNYPYDSLASQVIGFSNDLGDGIAGTELYYNSLLSGVNGRTYGYLNDDSEFEKTTIEPEHGNTLVLTLDMNYQEIVESKIREFDAAYGDKAHQGKGAENVGVVVMDPNSGAILAMATNSSYNLNDPTDFGDYHTGAEARTMTDEEYTEELNKMWSNFCVSVGYEPGSVFKPVTVASALETGAVKDGDTFYCDGGEFITDTTIHCDNIYGHGEETLEYAIVNSCNDALMQIGMKLGIKPFCAYQQGFNFGSLTGIDLPNESPGVVYSSTSMHEVELATCTFGQGFTCSMIQEIAAFSAVINGGRYYQPHVLEKVIASDGTLVKTVDPLILRQPISSQVSALLRQYLTTAVQKGTGQKSQVPGYLTGGKTGTAEKIDAATGKRDKGKYLVSFIGACPMDDPKVVMYIVVDEPNVDNQADSSYPQTLFRQIATELFPAMGLYPTEEVPPDLLQRLGLTEKDIVTDDGTRNRKNSDLFQAFDSYGVLHNDCYVDLDGNVVDTAGNAIEGAHMTSEGVVIDGYLNTIEVTLYEQGTRPDPVADNPDIASPPEASDTGDDTTTWAGVTDEDLAGEDTLPQEPE